MGEVYIDGLGNNIIYIKDNLKQEEEMVEVLSGGKMDQNIVVNFNKGSKLVLGYYIELEITLNMKEAG